MFALVLAACIAPEYARPDSAARDSGGDMLPDTGEAVQLIVYEHARDVMTLGDLDQVTATPLDPTGEPGLGDDAGRWSVCVAEQDYVRIRSSRPGYVDLML